MWNPIVPLIMLFVLFVGLVGLIIAKKRDHVDRRYSWAEASFTILTFTSFGLGLFYFLMVGVSSLKNIADPIPEMIRMSDFFVLMLTSNSATFLLPIIFTIWCKILSDDEDVSFKRLFGITVLILIVGGIISDIILNVILT